MSGGGGAAAEARGVLARALRGALDAGEGVPCLDPTRGAAWTAETYAEVAEAAEACAPCPVRAECREVGRHEDWGAWGGRVRGWRGSSQTPRATVRLVLATAPRPLSVAEVVEDATALAGSVPTRLAGDTLRRMAREGHAVADDATPPRYTITAAGLAAVEAQHAATAPGKGFASPATGARSLRPMEWRSDSTQNERSHIEGIDR